MADYTLFKLRGDTRANWLNANPILNNRELAMETDTMRFKVGDGLATYSQLPYGRNTGEYLNFYNVTAFLPLPAGYYYTHDQAISKVAVNERCKGLIVTYEVSSGVWYTERFIGSDVANWGVLANWEQMPDSSDFTALHDVITAYNNHAANTSNPHSVTKEQIGLLNVDNTSDANKPISTAQQTALNLKADKARQVIAGAGLTGGGTLESDRTINVSATDDSIVVASDGIKVDTQNLLTSTSATKPLAANQGKVLDEKITQLGADLNEKLLSNTRRISPIENKTSNQHIVSEDGFNVIDSVGNIGMKYDDDGLDVAAFANHFIDLLKSLLNIGLALGETESTAFAGNRGLALETAITMIQGIVSTLNKSNVSIQSKTSFIYSVNENGFYLCDSNGNIGAYVNNSAASGFVVTDESIMYEIYSEIE